MSEKHRVQKQVGIAFNTIEITVRNESKLFSRYLKFSIPKKNETKLQYFHVNCLNCCILSVIHAGMDIGSCTSTDTGAKIIKRKKNF